MKKALASLLLISMLISSFVSMYCQADEAEDIQACMRVNLENVIAPLTMDPGAVFLEDYKSVSGAPDGKENFACITDLSQSQNGADAAHGKVAHLKIHGNPGEKSNGGYTIAQRTLFNNEPFKSADVISFAYDINVVKMETEPIGILGYIADVGYCGFSYEGENLYISTDFAKGATDKATRITLPMENGTWHTLQYIFDGKNRVIYHLADGKVYSAVSFDGTGKSLDFEAEKAKRFYPEFFLRQDFESGRECEVYIDNVKILYGVDYEAILKGYSLSNSGSSVEAYEDIDPSESLDVTVNLAGDGKAGEFTCIAALYSYGYKSLCDIGVTNVSLFEDDTQKDVMLSLDALPEDVTSGEYELFLFIWKKDTLEPVIRKKALIENKELVRDGMLIAEAEDLWHSSDAKIIAQSDASGGYALKSTASSFAPSPEDAENVTVCFEATVPEIEMGEYSLWMRIRCTNTGNYSFWERYTGYGDYKVRYIRINPEYQWVKVASRYCDAGKFEYRIKHRDPGFEVDKFVFTKDGEFSPADIDDMPTPIKAPNVPSPDELYEAPPLCPEENTHPRLLVTKDEIAALKENAQHPVLAPMYREAARRGHLVMNCILPDKDGMNNINLGLAYDIECRAYLYLLGEVDTAHARQTVEYVKDLLSTVTWDRSEGDITRSMGALIATSSLVYDWCYDVLTKEDKEEIIEGMKKTMRQMEIGYPPKSEEIFAGHGGEGEVFYYQLAAAIAVYDEEPDMYNYVAGLLFEHMFDSRKLFMETGNHPAGSAYGSVRLSWEQLCSIIFDKMGYAGVMGDEVDKPSMRWIHDRLPNGLWFEDGDSWLSIVKSSGPQYNYVAYPSMLYGAYHNDNKYLRGEYIRSLCTKNYAGGTDIYNNAILTLVTLDPKKGYIYPDDEGCELPLSYFTSYPLTQGFMRTSWKEGIDSETAMVIMNGQEKLVGDHDHEHCDIGNFQIYYKGLLTGQGGTYSGVNGGWGAEHNYNYYRRTISHNCLTVFDPDEIFSHEYRPTYIFSNDGGQKIEKNTNFLPEFLSHPDEAKTEGKYAGPNEETPEFTYLKTDLTNAYSDKIKGYTRSMVAINLFNTDYPLAFICCDNVESSDKSFKKTWNLQAINEPEISGNKTVIERSDYGYSGRLVVNTLLPKEDNLTISTVGGEGFESYVNGVNYPNPDKEGVDHEQCKWRVEVSPKNEAENDLFLNAIYVTDTKKNLPDLPMYMEETEKQVGVTVMDKMVFFSKSREKVSEDFAITVRDNGYDTMCVLITDIQSGSWEIASETTKLVVQATQEENSLYVRLAPGTYSVSKTEGKTATQISYPRDERVERVGDFYVYDSLRKLFVYTKHPTILKDSLWYLSESDLEGLGVDIVREGEKIILTGRETEKVLTPGQTSAMENGSLISLSGAPFERDNILYICVSDCENILGRAITSDGVARIMKLGNAL